MQVSVRRCVNLQDIITGVFRRVLRTYQLDWLRGLEHHAYCAILGGRQIGKDLTLAFYATAKALMEAGTTWNTFSASAKHANQWLQDCRVAYRLIRETTKALGAPLPMLGDDGRKDNVTTIELHNGSFIHSNASTVKSAVGLRGSVLLNEIGVLANAKDMYEAVYPIVEGAIDNGRAGKMMIVSNASRRGTFWHQWYTGALSAGWHKTETTWESAMLSRGMDTDWTAESKTQKISRLGLGGYSQWYDCKWRASEEGFLSLATIDRQTYGPARPRRYTPRPQDPQIIGYDIGRVRDPSAWCRLLLPDSGEWDGHHLALPTEAKVGMTYRAQRSHLEMMSHERTTYKAVIDSTGLGDETAEECADTMPFEVTQFKFTRQSKQALFERLRASLRGGTLWIPDDDLDLRMEMESLTATYKAGGEMAIDIPREGGGHGDRVIALALAEHGAAVAENTVLQAWSGGRSMFG